MNIEELLHKGYVERSMMKTPIGGEYSEAHFFDENWNYTTKNLAEHMVVKEFDSNGNVINEISMDRKSNDSSKKNR